MCSRTYLQAKHRYAWRVCEERRYGERRHALQCSSIDVFMSLQVLLPVYLAAGVALLEDVERCAARRYTCCNAVVPGHGPLVHRTRSTTLRHQGENQDHYQRTEDHAVPPSAPPHHVRTISILVSLDGPCAQTQVGTSATVLLTAVLMGIETLGMCLLHHRPGSRRVVAAPPPTAAF